MEANIHRGFQEHSVAEFFKKNRQMLGYSGAIKSLTTLVHEYVTNAIDACEEAGIHPEIFVELKRLGPDHYKLIIEDNGPGIPKKIIGSAFGKMLAGTKFHRFQQSRGQQGIGATGCVMFSQITTGKPTHVISSLGDGKIFESNISLDIKTNEPKIEDPKEYMGQMRGTRIESEAKTVKYQKGEYSPDEYLRRTALANPHTKITYINPDNLTTVYDRAVEKIPKMPKPTKPHPKGLEVDDLMGYASATNARTIKSFLVNEFTRMSSQKASEIEKTVNFDMNKRPQDMKWEEAEQIVKTIKETTFISPPTDVLIPINEDHLEKALRSVLQPEFMTVLTRQPAIYRGGVPFIIEVALAYGGKAGKAQNGNAEENTSRMEIMRFANRVPLLFDAGACAITKAIQSMEWKRYKIQEDIPVTVLVNFTSVYVPYTGAGKESVADDEEIIKEIRLALMDSARKLGLYVSGQRRASERETKKKILSLYSQIVSDSLASILKKDSKKIKKDLDEIIEKRFEEINAEATEEEDLEAIEEPEE